MVWKNEKKHMTKLLKYLIVKNKLLSIIILLIISLCGCGSNNVNQTVIKYDYQNAV